MNAASEQNPPFHAKSSAIHPIPRTLRDDATVRQEPRLLLPILPRSHLKPARTSQTSPGKRPGAKQSTNITCCSTPAYVRPIIIVGGGHPPPPHTHTPLCLRSKSASCDASNPHAPPSSPHPLYSRASPSPRPLCTRPSLNGRPCCIHPQNCPPQRVSLPCLSTPCPDHAARGACVLLEAWPMRTREGRAPWGCSLWRSRHDGAEGRLNCTADSQLRPPAPPPFSARPHGHGAALQRSQHDGAEGGGRGHDRRVAREVQRSRVVVAVAQAAGP